MNMKVDEIKNALKKSAVIFETGGYRPTKELYESWIGRVGFCLNGETLPVDTDGNDMYPIAMLFLSRLPHIPCSLKEVEMLAVFWSANIYDHLVNEDFEGYYLIREYKSCEGLQPCDYVSKRIKPFPLTPKLVENDFPVWDGYDIPSDIQDEILRLENEDEIEYFEDICEDSYPMHKIGGYPSFCQSGVNYGDDYEFVFQISSDEKACFNIVDSGSFYFYRNIHTNEWKIHCDFY